MPTLEKLVDGFKIYKSTTFERDRDIIAHIEDAGIMPTTLVITSSDLQIAPQALTGSNPGDLYVIRLKAGLVEPYEEKHVSGFAATLEFGTVNLQVQNIIVLGHSHNDGLQLLLDEGFETSDEDPLNAWLGIAHDVYEAVKRDMANQPRELQERAMELETVVQNIRNLFSYPWLAERVEKGKLEIYGWHYDALTGQLLGYMPDKGTFEPIE